MKTLAILFWFSIGTVGLVNHIYLNEVWMQHWHVVGIVNGHMIVERCEIC